MLRAEETKALPMRPAGKEAGVSESKPGLGVSKEHGRERKALEGR